MKKKMTPWHITLQDSDQEHHHLTVEPKSEDEGEIVLRMTSSGETAIAITADSEDLGQFCRTALAILEERGLIDDDEDD